MPGKIAFPPVRHPVGQFRGTMPAIKLTACRCLLCHLRRHPLRSPNSHARSGRGKEGTRPPVAILIKLITRRHGFFPGGLEDIPVSYSCIEFRQMRLSGVSNRHRQYCDILRPAPSENYAGLTFPPMLLNLRTTRTGYFVCESCYNPAAYAPHPAVLCKTSTPAHPGHE